MEPDNITDKEFLQNLVSRVTPRKIDVKNITGKAAVSVILRFTPFSVGLSEASHLSFDQFMSVPSLLHEELQILYIKRAARETDRWSGHVAFPGGKLESDEDEKNCAIRETKEEIGVDLADETRFHFIGELGDWLTINRLLVSAFCWIQITPADLVFNLQTSEVHSTNWVPISYFKNVASSPVTTSTNFPQRGGDVEHKFPGVLLPTALVSPTDIDKKEVKYVLWGLTFAITCNILKLGGLSHLESLKRAIEEGSSISTKPSQPTLHQLLPLQQPKL